MGNCFEGVRAGDVVMVFLCRKDGTESLHKARIERISRTQVWVKITDILLPTIRFMISSSRMVRSASLSEYVWGSLLPYEENMYAVHLDNARKVNAARALANVPFSDWNKLSSSYLTHIADMVEEGLRVARQSSSYSLSGKGASVQEEAAYDE